MLFLGACKKQENQVVFEDGTPPVASASLTGMIPLVKADALLPAVTFSWTNPEYRFNTGISSQDVNYVVEMRKVGSVKFVATSITKTDLQKTFTQGELNDYLTKTVIEGGLELAPDIVQDIEVRITSYLGARSATNSTNLSSNIMLFSVKPYSTLPELWITGDGTASGWTNSPPDNQKFTYDPGTKKFTITQTFAPGFYYKFLTKSGAWQPQWGGASATGGTITVNDGTGTDPDAIPTPATPGTYTLTVDLINKTLVVQ
jgi:hypothetical protein